MVTQPAILVTGGAGFIGSCFVRQWLSEEDGIVVVLDKLTYCGDRTSLANVEDSRRLKFVEGDIADEQLVQRLLAKFAPQTIVNFAAESHVDRSIDDAAPFVETNVVGTWHLLEAALGHWRSLAETNRRDFRFVQVSSDEVFGSIDDGLLASEASPYAPNSPYAASKAAADHFVRAYHSTYGLPTIITYSCNNYGPFQFPEKLVPLVILNALDGRALPIYGDGKQIRSWIYVEDHCRALRQLIARATPGETYGIDARCERSNLDLVLEICRAVDDRFPGLHDASCSSLVKFVEDRPGHDRRYAFDATKVSRLLDWSPQIDLAQGLGSTVAWYADNSVWVKQTTARFDRHQRLGKRL